MSDLMRYVDYALIALLVPFILAGNPAPHVLGRRHAIAAAAAILGGLFSGFASMFPDFHCTTCRSGLAMNDALTAFVLAAALATLLYRLGTLLVGAAADASRS